MQKHDPKKSAFFTSAFFVLTFFACAADVSITQDDLLRRTQELYDAIVLRNNLPAAGRCRRSASQAHRYSEDPAVGKADPKKFADYIGAYELAPGQTRSVIAEGDKLFVERNGKKEQLLPETSEIFFRKDVEGRILFRYATTGKVDALIDRRNNEDVIWRKTK